jgi:hypothetical protein
VWYCKYPLSNFPPKVSIIWCSGGASVSYVPERYAGDSICYWWGPLPDRSRVMTQAKWDTLALQVGVRLTTPPQKHIVTKPQGKTHEAIQKCVRLRTRNTLRICIDWLVEDARIDWLTDWLINWLIDWLIYWLTDWSIDRSISNWVRGLATLIHLGLNWSALCAPISIHGSPVTVPKFQMAPRLIFLIPSGSKKKQPRYTCLSEAKPSHSQKIWAEFSLSAPHLHNGLSDSPIK